MCKNLNEKDILDFLAWKAAKLQGWNIQNATWRIGFQHLSCFYRAVVYSFSSRNFEALTCGGADLLVPRTSSHKILLKYILLASRVNPIYVRNKYEILPVRPSLEWILLEMDVNGWKIHK